MRRRILEVIGGGTWKLRLSCGHWPQLPQIGEPPEAGQDFDCTDCDLEVDMANVAIYRHAR